MRAFFLGVASGRRGWALAWLALAALAGCTAPVAGPPAPGPDALSPPPPSEKPLPVPQGEAVFYWGQSVPVDDSYEALVFTVKSLAVFFEDDGFWVEVELPEGGHRVNALAARAGVAPLARARIPAGRYTRLRLELAGASLLEKGEEEPVALPRTLFEKPLALEVREAEGVQAASPSQTVLFFDPYAVQARDGGYFLSGGLELYSKSAFLARAREMEEARAAIARQRQAPRIEETVFSSTVPAGSPVTVRWMVKGREGALISHTAVHFDAEGGKPADFKAYANVSEIQESTVPGAFEASFTPPSNAATVFFRVHAIVDGEHAYSPEYRVDVAPPPPEALEPPSSEPLPAEAVSLEATGDDRKFTPSSLSAPPGSEVTLTLHVASSGVSFGGLDFRSRLFDTGRVRPGEAATVSFTMPAAPLKVASYWPGSGVKKAELVLEPPGGS